MNPTPNQNYNVIKGLQIFINDIRECTTKEAEAKRVEKELDKIRKKLNIKLTKNFFSNNFYFESFSLLLLLLFI